MYDKLFRVGVNSLWGREKGGAIFRYKSFKILLSVFVKNRLSSCDVAGSAVCRPLARLNGTRHPERAWDCQSERHWVFSHGETKRKSIGNAVVHKVRLVEKREQRDGAENKKIKTVGNGARTI